MTVTAGAGVLRFLPASTFVRPEEKAFFKSRGVLSPIFGPAILAEGALAAAFKFPCIVNRVFTRV